MVSLVAGRTDRDASGQPFALAPLALSELCERFALFGMQALLFLDLRDLIISGAADASVWGMAPLRRLLGVSVDDPPTALASTLFGLTAGMVYLSTIAGGWIADRFVGSRRAIVWGGAASLGGYLLLFLESPLLLGLVLIAVGAGGFKGNIATEVGALFRNDDPRREQGFRLFFIAINLGILTGPLVCGTLGQSLGWRWGYMSAAVGMALGLLVYLIGAPRSVAPAQSVASSARAAQATTWNLSRSVAVTIVLLVLAAAFTGMQQIYNAYLGWANDSLRLAWRGHVMPTTWLLAVDSVLQLVMLVGAFWLWTAWRRWRREPAAPTKIAIGCALVGLAFGCLAQVPVGAGFSAIPWLLAFHAINSLGFAILFPVGLSLITEFAPARSRSTLVGLFYLQLALASFAAGALGRWLAVLSGSAFWLLHAGIILTAALIMFIIRRWVQRTLAAPTSLYAGTEQALTGV